jgi:membrane protein implicated in regulation of membrane protease activity
LVAARSNGGFRGTTLGLILCTAAVFTKQTQLPAGLAVFIVAFVRSPRHALAAAVIAGLLGIGAVGLMQSLTDGGFLHNIVGYNINRFSPKGALLVVLAEHSSLLFALLMPVAAGFVLFQGFVPPLRRIGETLVALRTGDRAMTARAMLLVYFALAGLMLATIFKSGASFNYFVDWFCVGGALIGVWLCDSTSEPRRFILVAIILALGTLLWPFRQIPDRPSEEQLAQHDALVQRIAEAKKPVASENMTLLMQAGKPVIFEPAIVTELALLGKWNEAPLVSMIRSGGFAFMITKDNDPTAHLWRTPGIDAAIEAAYPRTEQVAPDLWLHLPAD